MKKCTPTVPEVFKKSPKFLEYVDSEIVSSSGIRESGYSTEFKNNIQNKKIRGS